MALAKFSSTVGGNGRQLSTAKRLVRLANATIGEVSAVYAVVARTLIGRAEDFADFEAERRLRRVNLAAEKQHPGKSKKPRIRS